MSSFSSSNDNFTASNSKQGNQSSFNITQQAAIKEFEDKITAIANSLQDTINTLNDFKEETAADLGTKQDRLIPGSSVAINKANIISSNQINDSVVSGTETYSSDKIKSITDAIENNVNTKANISYVDTNFENIRTLIGTKQDKLTAGSGITISENTISTLNYIDDNKPVDNKSYSSLKTVQLDKDVYNNLYEYINSANYDGTILRIDSEGNRFGSIIHAYSGITPGTYGTKDYADTTLLPCFTINSEGHAIDVRLDEIYPPVTAGKTYDYWISNGSKRGNWQTPDSKPIDGSHNLITSGAVFTAVKHKGVFEAGLNIDISDYVISCTAIDNESISDTKTFSSSKIQNDMQQLDESINNIEVLIPAQATAENTLADRDFVNSSINSVTAFYITSNTEGSPFATKAALDNAAAYYYAGTERVPTANDYCVVLEDETHENKTVRYVYQSTEAGEGTWAFQYVVNDTPFTSDQLAAINSGITASKVSKYDSLENLIPDFTSDQLAALNSGITAEKVNKYDSLEDLIAEAKAEAILAAWPVGSIYIGTTRDNPSGILGGGTWVAFGEGRCLIGVGAGNDGSRTRTFTENETGGEYAHSLTTGEMPSHTHTFRGSPVTSGGSSAANTGSTQPKFEGSRVPSEENNRGHTHSIAHTHEYTPDGDITGGNHSHSYDRFSIAERTYKYYYGTGTKFTFDNTTQTTGSSGNNNTWTTPLDFSGKKGTTTSQSKSTSDGENQNHLHYVTADGKVSNHSHTMAHTHSVTASGTNDNTGGGGSHNNIQPYITVYMWKRTA